MLQIKFLVDIFWIALFLNYLENGSKVCRDCFVAGEAQWSNVASPVIFFMQVLLITTHQFIYVKPMKKIVQWVIDGAQIVSVGTVDFNIDIQCNYANSRKSSTMLKVVGKKRIVCTTSDIQHFLLVKIDQHLERMRLAAGEPPCDETEHEAGSGSRMEVCSCPGIRIYGPRGICNCLIDCLRTK